MTPSLVSFPAKNKLTAAPPAQTAGASQPIGLIAFDETVAEILRSALGHTALTLAFEATRLVKTFGRIIDEFVSATDDGGITFEWSSASGKELFVMINQDGSRRFFGVKGANGFREAGIVTSSTGMESLARWMGAHDRPLDRSTDGLAFG
jgi:hypothetical protein